VDIETEVVRLRAQGKLQEAAAFVVKAYGPEVLGFLFTMLRDRSEAHDAFGQACEDLWKGLPAFEGRSSMKTWFYTLARNAAYRLRRSPHRRRRVPLSDMSEAIEHVRSRTALHLRSEIKTGIASIRDTLDEADRALLVLRVDRDMSWADIAQVMSEGDCEEAELVRAAARLRQRFRTVKEIIRKRARDLGLIGERMEPDAEQ
jgi:RNA polymerase sigma-70 factor (ECF subfamily)